MEAKTKLYEHSVSNPIDGGRHCTCMRLLHADFVGEARKTLARETTVRDDAAGGIRGHRMRKMPHLTGGRTGEGSGSTGVEKGGKKSDGGRGVKNSEGAIL